jgi:hypothetical protein
VNGTILITLPASIPIGPEPVSWAGLDARDDGGQQLFGGGEQVLSFVSLWAGILQAIAGCAWPAAAQAVTVSGHHKQAYLCRSGARLAYLGGWPCARTHERSN